MKKLDINLLKNLTAEKEQEFWMACDYAYNKLLKDSLESEIKKSENKLREETDDNTINFLKSEIEKINKKIAECCEILNASEETYNLVICEMSLKNADGFGNNPDVVERILKLIGCWENPRLLKDTLSNVYTDGALYEALETINVKSACDELGKTSQTQAVKDAYKTASDIVDNLIKTAFSLPFESVYTEKTRVKMNGADKRLLNQCYIKSVRNKYTENENTKIISHSELSVTRSVRVKTNKKTGETTYNYSGLVSALVAIITRHYFN